MAWDDHWAHTRDWQAYHHYHRRHPGDNIPFPTPFHGSAKRKCGFFPEHFRHRENCRCNYNFVCLAYPACGFVLVGLKYKKNNNSHDNVYGAIILTKVIARVHPVHLMNVDWAPGGRQPSDQANRLGLRIRRNWQLSSTSTIAIVIITQPVSWYSFTVLRRVKGWVNLGTAVKVRNPCPRLYIAVAVTNTIRPKCI